MTSDTNGAMENYPICLSQMGEQMHSSSDKLPGCIAVNSKRDKLYNRCERSTSIDPTQISNDILGR